MGSEQNKKNVIKVQSIEEKKKEKKKNKKKKIFSML
jgi:hypothetical protein